MSDMEEDKPKVTITLRTIVTGPEAGSIIGRGGEVVNSIRWCGKVNRWATAKELYFFVAITQLGYPSHDSWLMTDSRIGSAFNSASIQGWIWGQNQDWGNKPSGKDHHCGWPHGLNFQGEIVIMAGWLCTLCCRRTHWSARYLRSASSEISGLFNQMFLI